MRQIADDQSLGPFSRGDHATITEVFNQYRLSTRGRKAAWKAISLDWYLGRTGRFYAYLRAHEFGSAEKPGKYVWVTITYMNNSRDSIAQPNMVEATKYAMSNISYSGGKVRRVEIETEKDSKRAVWDASWPEVVGTGSARIAGEPAAS